MHLQGDIQPLVTWDKTSLLGERPCCPQYFSFDPSLFPLTFHQISLENSLEGIVLAAFVRQDRISIVLRHRHWCFRSLFLAITIFLGCFKAPNPFSCDELPTLSRCQIPKMIPWRFAIWGLKDVRLEHLYILAIVSSAEIKQKWYLKGKTIHKTLNFKESYVEL